MLGYLIPLLIFAALGFAIYRKAPVEKRTLLWAILGAVVLVWFLSAVGVFGTAPASTVKPF